MGDSGDIDDRAPRQDRWSGETAPHAPHAPGGTAPGPGDGWRLRFQRLPAQGQRWTVERSRRLLAAQRAARSRPSVRAVPAPRGAPERRAPTSAAAGPLGADTGRLRGLDGLRAIAVAAVVIFHADPDWLPGGFLGVDVFFVISGFLITRLLLTELVTTGRLDFVRFYRRRARRLLPALAVVVTTCVVLSAVAWRDAFGTARADAVAAAGYVTNWWYLLRHRSYFAQTGRPPALTHLWSLGIEEQFYLLWPLCLVLVALAGRRIAGRRVAGQPGAAGFDRRTVGRAVVAVAVAGAGASTGLMAWLAIRGDVPFRADSTRVYFGTDTHCMGLMTGAALAAAALALGPRPGQPDRAGSLGRVGAAAGVAVTDLLGVGALVVTAWFLWATSEFSAELYRSGFLLVSLAAAVAVGAATRGRSRLGRALDIPPLRWLGRRSYEVYLWHWPVFVVTRPGIDLSWSPLPTLLARLAIVAVLAELTYRYVEQPVRDGRLAAALSAARTAGRRRAAFVITGATAVVVIASLPTASASPARQSLGRESSTRAGPPALPPAAPALPGIPTTRSAAGGAPGPGPGPAGAPPSRPTRAAATAPPGTAEGGDVSAFGDSVMLGAIDTLERALPGIRVEATEGIRAYVLLDHVRAQLKARRLGHVLVVHTGDNGIISKSDLEGLLGALKGRRLVLVNDRVDRDWEGPNNRLLAATARRHPGVVLLDWHDLSAGRSGWLYPDGLHLTETGAAAYASLVRHAVG